MDNSVGSNKAGFSVKNVIRAISAICLVCVFCPSFLVSCSGQTMKVNVFTAVGGVKMYGEKVVKGHPVMLLCFLIPIAVCALTFIKKVSKDKAALIILVSSAVNFILWLSFRSNTKKIVAENLCEFKTTGWYVLNMIAQVLLLLIALCLVFKRIDFESNLKEIVTGAGAKNALSSISGAVSQAAGSVASGMAKKPVDAIGYCSKCGAALEYGNKFCVTCGTPIPENILAEAEAKKAAEEEAKKAAEAAKAAEEAKKAEEAAKAAEEAKNEEAVATEEKKEEKAFCTKCGAPLSADAVFCEACGNKVK